MLSWGRFFECSMHQLARKTRLECVKWFSIKRVTKCGHRGARVAVQQCRCFWCVHSLLKPGVSGLRAGLWFRSRSPSSLVCPSIDSSLTGGDSDAQAGLDESVRNDSLPVPPDELLPEPKSKPLNLENFYQSSRITRNPQRQLRNTHLI